MLTCLGRRTLTGMLTAGGHQFTDWSAAYRLFTQERIVPDKLFQLISKELTSCLGDQHAIIAHLDDTLLKKTGKKVAGAAWRRDPLGPPFHTNFIWGQRFLQISLSLPNRQGTGQSRGIPVDFHHCPGIKKPNKYSSTQERQVYKEQVKQVRLPKIGSDRIIRLRNQLDQQGYQNKPLLINVDGSYTNAIVLKTLPPNTTLIGRIRKDAHLHELPTSDQLTGRKRVYGTSLPTPEQIRQSEEHAWQQVTAWAAGKMHTFDLKVITPVRWRKAGEKNLQVIIVRPLSYRLTKNSRLLYRNPAYLICTDPSLPLDRLLQSYLWRWEIEVNFREEKTLLGCGQAQVRHPKAVEAVPAFMVAVYSLLHLAAHNTFNDAHEYTLPRPRWYPEKKSPRMSSGDLINHLRTELWSTVLGDSFSGFVHKQKYLRSHRKVDKPLLPALFYMRK